jgi:hypothetical protein
MAQKVSRNRVHEDRLWDDAGNVWHRVLGDWVDVDQAEKLITSGAVRVVVHSFQGTDDLARLC